MGFIGVQPASVPLTASDITNDIINADKIADNSISEEHLDPTVITGLSALGAEPADTDEFLISDAGTLKRMDYSYIKSSGGGFTRLAGSNVTGQNLGDISFDNVFSSTYNLYYVIWRVNFTTNSSQLWLRLRDGSGFKTNSNYKFILTGENWSETESSISSSGGDSKFRLTGGLNSADDDTGAYGYLYFYRPYNSGKVTEVVFGATEKDESYVITSRVGAGSFQNTASCTGFGFLGSSQNLEDCDITVYGVNQS